MDQNLNLSQIEDRMEEIKKNSEFFQIKDSLNQNKLDQMF